MQQQYLRRHGQQKHKIVTTLIYVDRKNQTSTYEVSHREGLKFLVHLFQNEKASYGAVALAGQHYRLSYRRWMESHLERMRRLVDF